MRKILMITLVVVSAIAITTGVVYAAQVIDDALHVNSLTVGSQDVGGVTYFNGAILNNTVDVDGNNNPVTLADNVRIDGRVYRGAAAGTTDSLPFIVNDNMEVTGSLSVGGSSVTRKLNLEGNWSPHQAGDTIVRADQGYSEGVCNANPAFAQYIDYHWAKIAVPQISLTDMPMIMVYNLEYDTAWGQPESGLVWEMLDSSNVKFVDGYVYVNFKSVHQLCGGGATVNTVFNSGDYKIVVIY